MKTGATILNLVYDSINQAIRIVGSSFGLDSDATHGDPANDTTNQVSTEAKDFDGSALPNAVNEGDAVRPASTLYGIQYSFPTNEDGSLTPVNASGNFNVDVVSSTGANLAQETGGNLDTIASSIGNLDTLGGAIGTDGTDPGASPDISLMGGEYRTIDSAYNDGEATILQTDLAGKLKTAGYDGAFDIIKIQEQSPLPSFREDFTRLVTTQDVGVADGVAVNQGSGIATAGYTKLGLWVDFIANDSIGSKIQVLVRREASGDDHELESLQDYQRLLGDSSKKVFLSFELDNLIREVQVQTLADDVISSGGTTEATVTIDYTKGWA